MNSRLVKDWLQAHDMSREALADRLGVSSTTMQRILSGRKTPPKTTIIALAAIMGIKEVDLVPLKRKTAQAS
jgi:transcriptional regulator with XRE-family HTH domain